VLVESKASALDETAQGETALPKLKQRRNLSLT